MNTNVIELVPHKPPFLFVKNISEPDLDNFTTEICLESLKNFITDGHLNMVTGIELIAQSIALFSAIETQSSEGPSEPKKGMIVSIQKFNILQNYPKVSTPLKVNVNPVMRSTSASKFYGCVMQNENIICEATMMVVLAD